VSHHHVGLVPDGTVQLLLLTCALAGWLVAARAARRRGRAWPATRTVSWSLGLACAAVAVAGPLAAAGHADFRAHMTGHLLLGMLAPLLVVSARPVTLALGALPARSARRLAAVLRSRPVAILTHPVVAAGLDVGGLWVVYRTGLYPAAHGPLVQAHVFLAGVLFTASVVGRDPAPHRAALEVRAAVLVGVMAAHGILAKSLYAGPPPGVPAARAEAGAQVMYYGGTVVELALLVLLGVEWYRRTGRRTRRTPVRRGYRPAGRSCPGGPAVRPAATADRRVVAHHVSRRRAHVEVAKVDLPESPA
jgi:putative membrane protein